MWVYSMLPVTSWVGPLKPDQPNLQEGYQQNISEYNELESRELEGDYEQPPSKEFFENDGDPNPEPSTLKKGWISLGIHVDVSLYSDPRVRRALRIYTVAELQSKFPRCTRNDMYIAKETTNLGCIRTAELTLKAVSDCCIDPLFGKQHKTEIHIGACAILDEVSNYFRDNSFKVGVSGKIYKVVPGSFKLKRVRRNAITLL